MLETLKSVVEWVRRLSPPEIAKLAAYWLAPGFILLLTASGMFGGSFAIDLARPIVVSELKTEILSAGGTMRRPGFAVVIEPAASEFRIELPSEPPGIWTSLDEPAARANTSRLTLDRGGLHSKAPFLGIAGPVTIVVEGQLGETIQVPGGTEKVDDLVLRSRRSVSVMTSVLLACIFAFGMSSAVGFPSMNGKKNAGRQMRAQPNEH